MGYSRSLGSHEGATLIFAHSVQEAKKIGWQGLGSDLTDEYIDFACTIIRDSPWLFSQAKQELLEKDIAHENSNPISCKACEQWGGEMDEDGICRDCSENERSAIEVLSYYGSYKRTDKK